MLSLGQQKKKFYQKIIDDKKEKEDIAFDYHLQALAEENLFALVKALYFVDEEVETISTWLYNKTKGKMYWVSACLQNLFLKSYLEPSLRGWRIVKGRNIKEVSIPSKMAQAMESKFKQMDSSALKLLQYCAECGQHFNSNLISKLLGKPRMEVLYILNQIQNDSNLIFENTAAAAAND